MYTDVSGGEQELFPYLIYYSIHLIASSRPVCTTLFQPTRSLPAWRKYDDSAVRQKTLRHS